jgi:hypothetical protein
MIRVIKTAIAAQLCSFCVVQELSEAEEPDHVAAEAADLLFFALTR